MSVRGESSTSASADFSCDDHLHCAAVIEEPTYFLAGKIITDHHVSLARVQVGPAGLDIKYVCVTLNPCNFIVSLVTRGVFLPPSELEQKLRSGELRPRLVYTIPVFQNPTGVTMSHADRVKLASLAHEFDFIVAADEV
jgi:2-aminoadipate transaminase